MKNLLKFGFLGLAFTLGVAACNQPTTTETEAEATTEAIDSAAAAANDSIDSAAAAANDAIDSAEEVIDSATDVNE